MVRQSNIGWPLSKKCYRLSFPLPCQLLRQSGSGATRQLNGPRDEFLGARLRVAALQAAVEVARGYLFLLNGT
jgi:hypothetical protein